MSDSFRDRLSREAAEIDTLLDQLLTTQDNPQKNIYLAMRYSLLAGGKRIRPVLALAAADVLGAERDLVRPFACGLEMIHTYSLIHDDLPAMDDDDLRRGRPTCHKRFGEAMAILAGDALLNKAFEVMSEAVVQMEDPRKGAKMLAAVACQSGTEGMIGGQVVDLESEGKSISRELLEHMYRCKTGALLKAPVLVAIEAKGCAGSLEAGWLLRYAEVIGLAFQVKDDLLDREGSAEVLGKAIGSDEKEHKTTFVSLLGIPGCKTLLEELTEEAIALADRFGERGRFLRELAQFLLVRQY